MQNHMILSSLPPTPGKLNDLDVQPGALLVTAAASVTVDALNEHLRPFGLCLPIYPLVPGLTLAEAVAANAGGRRELRYGTIVRYLRAATCVVGHTGALVSDEQQPSMVDSVCSALVCLPATLLDRASMPVRIECGGPTLKRATGYGLHRALVGNGLIHAKLERVTCNLRPLPSLRRAFLLECASMAVACQLADQVLATGVACTALAFLDQPAAAVRVLIELEGTHATLDRQVQYLQPMIAALTTGSWQESHSAWELWAVLLHNPSSTTLSMNLPRLALPGISAQAHVIQRRYGLDGLLWGDVGTGQFHWRLTGGHAGEMRQAAGLLYAAARQRGGTLCSEPLATGCQHQSLTASFQSHEARSKQSAGRYHATATIMTPPSLLQQVRDVVGSSYVLTSDEDLACYATDASIAQAEGKPLAVVLPSSTAEVSQVLRLCDQAGVAVVTRGAGSGLAGGALPTPGALLLGLSRMQQLRIDTQQMVAHVEAGAITADLQRAAEACGLFYPPDPSSQGVSTIGGNIACNAGGPRCLKYGVTADYVLGLTAVLADGRILRVGDSVAGQSFDAGLLQLLIGSEGTLAVITEATLRLIPMPPARRTTLAIFDRLEDACTTVEAIMASGLLPASLELMDDTTIAVVEAYLHLGLPGDAGALLLLLADGEPEAVEAEAQMLADMARRGGARVVQVATSATDEAALWRARRAISPALGRVRPNRLGEDICVPLPHIAEAVRQIKDIAARYDLPIAVFGHAGDGNLHPNILFDARDPQQVTRTWQAAEAIFAMALNLDGTLSGEHGIGMLKRPFLAAALGEDQLAFQRAIKAALDPHSRLNPGKVLV